MQIGLFMLNHSKRVMLSSELELVIRLVKYKYITQHNNLSMSSCSNGIY